MNALFEVHMLNDEGKQKAKDIAESFERCLEELSSLCPDKTREFALVKTKLEEACFFAKKSMASLVENQQL